MCTSSIQVWVEKVFECLFLQSLETASKMERTQIGSELHWVSLDDLGPEANDTYFTDR